MARVPRTPPKPPFWDADPGICRGCGEEFLTQAGERARNRRWCESCKEAWRIAGHPTRARAAVFARDRGICHDCGTDCTTYRTFGPDRRQIDPTSMEYVQFYQVQINRERALAWCDRILGKTENPRNPQSEYAIDLGEWHVDHAMPLHLVDRDSPEAWREWTLPNLRTRCPSCHEAKTVHEAKMRGKIRRLNGTTKKNPKAKIPQRANPWPKRGARSFNKGAR